MRIVAAPTLTNVGSGREQRKARRFPAVSPGESGLGQGDGHDRHQRLLQEAS